ncbi:MAG: DNA ligase (NAD(+)) LigA [Opitutus sp.]|nr:DNA ligase (NAD(+)) LigA [Opitutus sp.]
MSEASPLKSSKASRVSGAPFFCARAASHPHLNLGEKATGGGSACLHAGRSRAFPGVHALKIFRPFVVVGAALLLLCVAASSLRLSASAADRPPDLARLESLRVEIAHHDELYFKKAAPEITDAEYDALKRELRNLEARIATDPAAIESSPNDALGDDRSGRFPGYRHRVPMLGLEKSFSESELRKFLVRVTRTAGAERVTWIIEPKYDGLAISLTYERGRLVRAVTRGDGVEGDDVTSNLLACVDVPRDLRAISATPMPDVIELRGEVYLDHTEFERINAERRAAGETMFVHPRNLAVGTLKSSDPAVLRSRRLTAVFYGWGECEPATLAPGSQRALLERLSSWGFRVPPAQVAHGPETVWQLIRALDVGRTGFPGPLDGAVVKVDDAALRARLGQTATAPLWAIAHKFEPERVETRLKAITLQVGRTGVLTPVAELEPVEIGGTMIARASLHNRQEIARRDYRIGDTVRVEKAGEIIPQLAGVNLVRRSGVEVPFAWPDNCPSCRAPVTVEEVAVRCANYACPGQLQRRIEHFCSAEGLEIRGLGPALIGTLIERGLVRDAADLYRISRENWMAVVGLKSAERLVAEIERSRRAELRRVICGVGLPGVGATHAQKLALRFGGLAALRDASRQELESAGLTAAVATDVMMELKRPEVRMLLDGLLEAGVAPQPIERAGALSGATVVFTGTLATLTRAEAEQRVRAAGGAVRANVTAETSFVVEGEGAGRKLVEARKLGVPVLTEAEFLARLAPD